MASAAEGKTWRIEDTWASPPRRRRRGRPHQSYKEAIDLQVVLRAEEIYRQGAVSPMAAIRRAVDEAWESARYTRLPDESTKDCRGYLGSTKEQIVRRVRDRFRAQRIKRAGVTIPSPLEGTPLGLAFKPGTAADGARGFSFGGLRAISAKKGTFPPWLGGRKRK